MYSLTKKKYYDQYEIYRKDQRGRYFEGGSKRIDAKYKDLLIKHINNLMEFGDGTTREVCKWFHHNELPADLISSCQAAVNRINTNDAEKTSYENPFTMDLPSLLADNFQEENTNRYVESSLTPTSAPGAPTNTDQAKRDTEEPNHEDQFTMDLTFLRTGNSQEETRPNTYVNSTESPKEAFNVDEWLNLEW